MYYLKRIVVLGIDDDAATEVYVYSGTMGMNATSEVARPFFYIILRIFAIVL